MRTKSILACLAITVLAGAIFTACRNTDPSKATTASAPKALYHCPMHPSYTSDKPGDCPICGMRLVLIDAGSHTASSTGSIPGQATVQIPAGREQLIGLTTAQAEVRDLFLSIRASARVAYDPGLYSAILEHREAVSALQRSRASGNADFLQEAESTVRASRLRLRQLGLSDEQIAQSAGAGFDPSNLLLGQPGESVWAYIDLYDYEVHKVGPGQRVILTSNALPGKEFEGRIKAIDQVVNAETRTLRARAEIPNPKGDLKPEMYLNAMVYVPLGKRLSVPSTAVLDTGVRRLVFVVTGPGTYEPRDVTVGHEASGFWEILNGLKAGDTVVNSANFLIDSESKIRGAVR